MFGKHNLVNVSFILFFTFLVPSDFPLISTPYSFTRGSYASYRPLSLAINGKLQVSANVGICFGTKNAILRLDIPDNPSKPCLSCTKQWCLNQNLPICAGASLGDTDPDTASGKEGDVEARCFQRDSPRDQLVVTLFLLTVFGLLLGAGIKGRMLKAGIDTSLPWDAGRKWWQALVPRRFDDIGMRVRLPNSTRERGDYVVVSNGGGDGS